MSDVSDKKKIRAVMKRWLDETAAGNVDEVLKLMADDAVFLRAGHPPMRGAKAFAAQTRAALAHGRITGKLKLRELRVLGRYAYAWGHLTVSMVPVQGRTKQSFSGDVLSIYRKERNGSWVLYRDANLLAG